MCRKNYTFFVLFFTLLSFTELVAQPNFDFSERATWDGPFDIKMVSAPNLQPVFIDQTEALAGGTSSGRLLADSLITTEIMRRTGDLFEINNRYKDGSSGSVFEVYDIPVPAVACKGDPNVGGCVLGYDTRDNNSSCPAPNIRYDDPLEVERYVSMTYADYDEDMNTFSSSMAELDISGCSEIEAAYLYWTGNFEGSNNPITLVPGPLNSYSGTGDVFNASNNPGEFDEVLFKIPGGNYQNVTADTRYASSRSFVCVADVTAMVNGLTGGGEFWVANLKSYPIEESGGSTSGWTLVVVFRSPLSPPRLISLFDGFKNIESGDDETFVLTGLQAPATANFKSYVGFAALDGENLATQLDDSDDPEGLGFQTNNGGIAVDINPFETDQPPYKLYKKDGLPAECNGDDNIGDDCDEPLYDANWCSVYDGVSSSHITSYDEATGLNGNEINRLPNNVNTLGYDAHHMILPDGAVAPGATEATLTVRAGPQGSTLPFLSYLAIERLQPKLSMTKTADKNATGLSTQIEYSFIIKNEGNAPSLGGDIIYDTLDAATNYVSGSLNASRGNVSLLTSTNDRLQLEIPDPIIEGDSVVFTFLVDVIPYAEDPSLFNPPVCKRTIENTAYVEYNTISSGILQTKSNSNDCGIGSETRVVLVDEEFTNSNTSYLGPYDGCILDTAYILDRVREELINAGVALETVEDFDIRDSLYNRIRPEDRFGTIEGTVKYIAIQDINTGAGCQEIYEVSFECINCEVNVTSPSTATVCSGEPLDYAITADVPGTNFIWERAEVPGIDNASVDNQTTNPITETLVNSSAAPVVVTYQIIPDSPCDVEVFELEVTVNPLPTGAFTMTTPTICPGDTTPLTVNYQNNSGVANNMNIRLYDENGVRIDSAKGIADAPGAVGFPVYQTGDYTATIEHASQGCMIELDPVALNHYDSLKAILSNDAITCANGDSTANIDVTITAGMGNGPYSYSYRVDGESPIDGGTFTGDATTFESQPFPLGAVTPREYTLSNMTDANGCSAFPEDLTGTVTVSPLLKPVAAIAQNDGEVLTIAKVSVDLSDDNALPDGYDRLWVMDANGSSATLTNFSDSITTAQGLEDGDTVIVVLEISDENSICRSDQDSIKIVKIDITIAQVENDTLCYNSGTVNHSVIPLTVPNTAIGEEANWSAINTAALATSFTTNPTNYQLEVDISAPGNYIFEYTISNPSVTDAEGEPLSSSMEMTLVVDEAVTTPNAGKDTTICANSYTLEAAAPVSGSGYWDDQGQDLTFSPGITAPNATVSGFGVNTFSLQWIVESDLGICPSASNEITITNTGSLTVPTTGKDTTICATDLPVTLEGNTAAIGETVQWTGPGTLMNAATRAVTVSDLAAGTYGYSYTISNGVCPDLSDNVLLTVVAPPSTANAGSDDEICGDTYQLNAATLTRGTGRWEIVDGVATISDSHNKNATLSAIDGTVTLDWITATDPVCAADTDRVVITAIEFVTPELALNVSDADRVICAGDVITFTAIPTNGGTTPTYRWQINDGSPINAPATYIANNLNQSTNTIEVTMTPGADIACPSVPSVTTAMTIERVEKPTPVIFTTDKTLCETDLDISIQGSVSTGEANWYKDGVAIEPYSGTPGAVSYTLDDVSDAGTYQLREDNGICPAVLSNPVTIAIDYKPYADVEGGFDILLGETVTLKGETNATSWLWESEYADIADPTQLVTTATPQQEGINEYTLTVVNGLCDNEATVIGYVRLPIEIPNVFTPNNDGDNDEWTILGLEAYPNMQMKIFNRWGNIVHKEEGEFIPWDGNRKGNPMPVATYYYVIELNEEGYEPLTGSVTIVR